MKHLEVFILSLYQSFDPQNSGYIDPSVFWQVWMHSKIILILSIYNDWLHIIGLRIKSSIEYI